MNTCEGGSERSVMFESRPSRVSGCRKLLIQATVNGQLETRIFDHAVHPQANLPGLKWKTYPSEHQSSK